MGSYLMARFAEDGQRNPETLEELFKMFTKEIQRRYYSEEGSDVRSFMHDQLLINKVMNQTLDELEADKEWHNSAFIYTARDFTESVLRQMITDPAAAVSSFEGLFAYALKIGYMLGEGAEHIVKCHCKDEVERAQRPTNPRWN